MNPALDEIVFGNPSQKHTEILNHKSDFLDAVMPRILEMRFPPNSSVHVQDELREIQALQKTLFSISSAKAARYKFYEEKPIEYVTKLIELNFDIPENFKINETITQIFNDCLMVSTIAKFHFNRPRPNQMAFAYKKGVFPKYISDSPSYPCGQVLFGCCVTKTFGAYASKGMISSDLIQTLDATTDEIGEKCLAFGTNYPSDIDGAMEAAEIMCSTELWKKKYRI